MVRFLSVSCNKSNEIFFETGRHAGRQIVFAKEKSARQEEESDKERKRFLWLFVYITDKTFNMLVNSLIFCNLTRSWSTARGTLHIRWDPYISRRGTGSLTVLMVFRSACHLFAAVRVLMRKLRRGLLRKRDGNKRLIGFPIEMPNV